MTQREEQPRTRPSDEANQDQLRLAHEQGHILGRTVKHMILEEAHGEERVVGDYLIAYAVEQAEGMYRREGDQLIWHDPEDENAHIEVVVRDSADGRFIPGLTVYVTVIGSDGQNLGPHHQPFIWHPWLHHYGRNWSLPGDGSYSLRVRVDPPDFMRHDRLNGGRFTEPVSLVFSDVSIRTGRKMSG